MKNIINENWKSVDGYEGIYEVSNLGRVRSLDRLVSNRSLSDSKRLSKGRILKTFDAGAGYQMVCLSVSQLKKKHYVHRLVMSAFVGNSELTVNHINDNKKDNRLSNLEYCTQKENCNRGNRNKKLSEIKRKSFLEGKIRRNKKGQWIRENHLKHKEIKEFGFAKTELNKTHPTLF